MKRIAVIITVFGIVLGVKSQDNKIETTGNVGIGTTNPSKELDVNGNIVFDKRGSSHTHFQLGHDSNDMIISDNSPHQSYGGGYFFRVHDESLNHKYRDVMMLTKNGNVGIGTTNPSNSQGWARVLDVAGSQHSKILATSVNSTYKVGMFSHNSWHGGGGFLGTESNHTLHLIAGYSPKMTILTNGNIGIGTLNPSKELDVNGNIVFNKRGSSHTHFQLGHDSNDMIISDNSPHQSYGGGYFFRVHDESLNHKYRDVMMLTKNGNIGIGTTNPGSWKLAVNGKIRAKEIKVETGWSDFVFYKDYKLPTLIEVENHIKEKGHLKDIPSAAAVAENGIYLGEMDAKLLQKIEELTLYTIEQQKEIQELKEQAKEIEEQNSKIEKQEQEILELKKQTKEISELKLLVKELLAAKK